MIAVISPAKTLDYQSPVPDLAPTAPHFAQEAETLAKDLIDLSITIDLTERVEVRRGMVGGKPGTIMTHLEDLLPPDTFPGAEDARLWIGIADDLAAGTATPVVSGE